MFKVYLCLVTQHDWRLLPFAALVCVVSTLTTFFLYARTPSVKSWRRCVWLATTALVAGSGIWTTHFVAMLAFKTGLPESYDPVATFESFAVAVAFMAIGPSGSGTTLPAGDRPRAG